MRLFQVTDICFKICNLPFVIDQTQETAKTTKKSRPTSESSLSAIAIIFGEMAKDSFTSEKVWKWHNRIEAEANSTLKWAMGEVFYHGLNILATKYVRIKHLEHLVGKVSALEASHHEKLVVVQSKANEEVTTHRKELGTLQRELDDVKLKSLKEKEALTLRSMFDLAQGAKDSKLGDTYNVGFFAYLKAFPGGPF